jgi:hypothetical protein
MNLELRQKVLLFQVTTLIGVVFGLVAFSYNVWRMEITEANSNTRMACFEILTELAELEQLLYAAHYDQNESAGSPRTGWVKVGLVGDLSVLASSAVEDKAGALKATWAANWENYSTERTAVEAIVEAIELVREDIKVVLRSLS